MKGLTEPTSCYVGVSWRYTSVNQSYTAVSCQASPSTIGLHCSFELAACWQANDVGHITGVYVGWAGHMLGSSGSIGQFILPPTPINGRKLYQQNNNHNSIALKCQCKQIPEWTFTGTAMLKGPGEAKHVCYGGNQSLALSGSTTSFLTSKHCPQSYKPWLGSPITH